MKLGWLWPPETDGSGDGNGAEAATRHWPACGGTAAVAIEAFAAAAKEEQWASWAAPLAASMLGTAYPVPSPNLWLKAPF